MQLKSDDVDVHLFVPDDGSESAAIKIIHRGSHHEVVNEETLYQRRNLRRGLFDLVKLINPSPKGIRLPRLMIFDRVSVRLPETTHDGEVTRISWDFVTKEWKYYVQCRQRPVTRWYEAADLDLLDE